MKFHVGIYPSGDCAFLYNDFDKKINTIDLFLLNMPLSTEEDLWDPVRYILNEIITPIKSVNGEYGCLCVTLEGHTNKIRKNFIEYGKEIGFEQVSIIDCETSLYLHAVYYCEYIPVNNDVIWIIESNSFHVWQIQNEKARHLNTDFVKCMESEKLEHIITSTKTNMRPNVVLYNINLFNDKFNSLISSLNCNYIAYDLNYDNRNSILYSFWNFGHTSEFDLPFNEGPLIKARLMANDPDMLQYETENMLGRTLLVKLLYKNKYRLSIENSEHDVIKLHKTLLLPFKCLIKIKCRKDFDNLIIEENSLLIQNPLDKFMQNDNVFKSFVSAMLDTIELPNCEEMLLTFDFDTNGIFELKIQPMVPDTFPCADKFIDSYKLLNFDKNIKLVNFSLSKEIQDRYCIRKQNFIDNHTVNAIGIDLGTSRCCAAVNRLNGIESVALENTGERLLPSYVSFDEEKEKCGQTVVKRLQHFATSTVFDVKRFIGKRFENASSDNSWPFTLIKEAEKLKIQCNSYNGTIQKNPEEISAVLLKHIKQKAEEFQGKRLNQVVITVPAVFDAAQNVSTRAAALLAGWEKIDLLPEPVAAAFAYFVDRPIPDNSTLLVFDLGGGTLDVCIFKLKKDTIHIESKSGSSEIGGRDFDNILIEHFKEKLYANYEINIDENKKYRIMLACQEIKHILSVREEDKLYVDNYHVEKEGHISITRDMFKELSAEILQKIELHLSTALDKVGYRAFQIDRVLQVGGGCRMPMIKELLKNVFPDAEHCCEEHPEEVVARGAAYYAYYLQSTEEDKNWCPIM